MAQDFHPCKAGTARGQCTVPPSFIVAWLPLAVQGELWPHRPRCKGASLDQAALFALPKCDVTVESNSPALTKLWDIALTVTHRRGAGCMFDISVSVYPTSKTKQDLGLEADMPSTSDSFGTYLSMLKCNGLIEVTGADIKASDNLFIEAHKAIIF